MSKSHADQPCPSCGYCPTCGRRNAAPVYPGTLPYYPWGTYPYFWQIPNWTTVTSGGPVTTGTFTTVPTTLPPYTLT